jgi:cell division transport system permease protein
MHDMMRYLPENPLPAVIEVVHALTVDSQAKLDLLAGQLGTLAFVEQVKLDMDWMKRLQILLGFANQLTKALMLLLALAVVLIIGNTLRLSLHHRHEEIQILKLIGATESFILRPFLYSGIWYGLAGAVIAVFLVNIFIISLAKAVNQLIVAYQMHYSLIGLSVSQILLLLMFAVILGWLGARLSVKQQLASIEPY